MLHDLAGIGRGRGHQEILLAEPPGRAVVEHQPVLAQHQPVARLADRQRREDVGVDAVEEIRGVRPLHGDLAERRDVDDAGRLARRRRLAHIGLLDRLAGQAIDHRAVPEAGRIHRRAVGDMPVVHRRQPLGPDLAVALGRQRADRHRRERRAEARRADLGDLLAERVRHDGEAGHVRGLALVGRHAERRVALQMLDRDRSLRDGRGGCRRRSRRAGSRRRLCLAASISKTGAGAMSSSSARPRRDALRRRSCRRVRPQGLRPAPRRARMCR